MCARHDAPATGRQARTFFTGTPAWAYLFLLLGLVPLLVVLVVLRRRVKGWLPTCGRCTHDRRRYLYGVAVAWLVCVTVFVLAVAVDSGALLGGSFVALVVAGLVSLAGDQLRVRGLVARDRQWVRLDGVGSGFAATGSTALAGAATSPQVAGSRPGEPHPSVRSVQG